MTLPPALAQNAPPETEPVAEERVIFLPAPERADRVLLGDQALSVFADRQRTPYIEQLTAAGVHIRLTDWVGRLTFRLIGERSVTEHAVTVYPAKLSRDPEQAFAALGQMLASVGEWERRLGLAPQGAPTLEAGPPAPPVTAAELLRLGEEAWRLGQAARRSPGPPGPRARERRVPGGAVPDRVDWARTLDLWGRGAPGEHAAQGLPRPQVPLAAPALLELWSALLRAAQTLPEGPERRDLLGRLATARAAWWRSGHVGRLSRAEGSEPTGDPISCRVRELTDQAHALTRPLPTSQVSELQTSQGQGSGAGPPRGSVRMAELYEFWAQLTLAGALGAEEGEVTRTPDGTGQGVLRGQVSGGQVSGAGEEEAAPLTVQLNPRLAFAGVGPATQTLQPDLSALLGRGGAAQVLVADVKYRPLDRLNTDAQREINDQLLRYMGLLHAPTGLILWPGLGAEDVGERCRVSTLPGGRARLVRLRLHPADPPGQLGADLRRLGLLGPPHPPQGEL